MWLVCDILGVDHRRPERRGRTPPFLMAGRSRRHSRFFLAVLLTALPQPVSQAAESKNHGGGVGGPTCGARMRNALRRSKLVEGRVSRSSSGNSVGRRALRPLQEGARGRQDCGLFQHVLVHGGRRHHRLLGSSHHTGLRGCFSEPRLAILRVARITNIGKGGCGWYRQPVRSIRDAINGLRRKRGAILQLAPNDDGYLQMLARNQTRRRDRHDQRSCADDAESTRFRHQIASHLRLPAPASRKVMSNSSKKECGGRFGPPTIQHRL